MPPSIALTAETFADFVRTHRFAVVHFHAAWNGTDLVMQRLLESQIPEELYALVAFARVDVDPPAHHPLCRRHDVRNVPFLALYRSGSLVRSVTGIPPPENIVGYLRDLVQAPSP